MQKCLLTKDEYEFFKRCPHCIASVCDKERIGRNGKFTYNYANTGKYVESGFPTINIGDVKREKLIYETVEDLGIDAIRDMGGVEKVKYHEGGSRPKTSLHIGQLKLFLSTMQFLLKYSKKGEETHVIYPGSAPGTNIELLTNLFPHCYWYLYDPRDIFHNELYENDKVKKIVVDFFLEKHIEELKTMLKDKHVLLISDIRVCSDETEETIDRDMKLQADWVKNLRPTYSCLKFRLPRNTGKEYKYLIGEAYLQIYARVASTETRLVVGKPSGKDEPFAEAEYDVDLYEGLMYYFNKRARLLSYHRGKLMYPLDTCHDCVAFYSLIEDYNEEYKTFSKSEELVKLIIEKMGKYKISLFNKELLSGLRVNGK